MRYARVAHRIDHSIWGEILDPDPNAVPPRFDWEDLTGWMRCDGRSLRTNTHPGLFGAIQFTWGGDRNQGIFKIPDLRGYFLRGVEPIRDQSVAVDKDSAARFAREDLRGGKLAVGSSARPKIGNLVGSYQPFATALPQGDPRIDLEGGSAHTFKTRIKTAGPQTHIMRGARA